MLLEHYQTITIVQSQRGLDLHSVSEEGSASTDSLVSSFKMCRDWNNAGLYWNATPARLPFHDHNTSLWSVFPASLFIWSYAYPFLGVFFCITAGHHLGIFWYISHGCLFWSFNLPSRTVLFGTWNSLSFSLGSRYRWNAIVVSQNRGRGILLQGLSMLGLNNFAHIQEIALSASLAVVLVSLAVCSWFPLL